MTSSVLVVNFDETKFECTINSKVDAIDRIKIQKIKFFPKVACIFLGSSPDTLDNVIVQLWMYNVQVHSLLEHVLELFL